MTTNTTTNTLLVSTDDSFDGDHVSDVINLGRWSRARRQALKENPQAWLNAFASGWVSARKTPEISYNLFFRLELGQFVVDASATVRGQFDSAAEKARDDREARSLATDPYFYG